MTLSVVRASEIRPRRASYTPPDPQVSVLLPFAPRSRVVCGSADGRTLTRPGCPTRHRTPVTVLRCMLPQAAWVLGRGEWASIAPDGRALTVKLHLTRESAERALSLIDATACGGFCDRRHYLGRVDVREHALVLLDRA